MERVIICRKWNEADIKAYVTNKEIGSEMAVDEYLEALVQQVTNLSFTFTKATLLAKLKEGHNNIATEMKQVTKYIV